MNEEAVLNELLESKPGALASDLAAVRLAVQQGWTVNDAIKYFFGAAYVPELEKPDALFRGVAIHGFTGPETEMIRAYLSRIPQELILAKRIEADSALNATHGRYDPDTDVVFFNPKTFQSRQVLGRGHQKVNHAQLTLVHEFMHALYNKAGEKVQDKWRALSGWMKGTQAGQAPPYTEKRPGWPHTTSSWTHREGAEFSRPYAGRNDDEDFADAAAFFILGKVNQAGREKKKFLAKLLVGMIRKFPQGSLQGPEHD